MYADAQADLRLCCSFASKSAFFVNRPLFTCESDDLI